MSNEGESEVTLEDWLNDIESKVKSNILESRIYESYFFDVDYDADPDPFYIFRAEGEERIETIKGRTTIILAPLRAQKVYPVEINLRFGGEWKIWFSDPTTFVHLGHVWRKAVTEENKKIMEILTKDLEEVEIKSSNYDDIEIAQEMVVSNNNFPDVLLLNYIQLSNLLKIRRFKHYSQLPQTFIEKRGKAFGGIFGALSVYWNQGLSIDEGIIYERRPSNLKMTRLDVGFNSYTDPEILHVNEHLYAWFTEEGSAVKLKII